MSHYIKLYLEEEQVLCLFLPGEGPHLIHTQYTDTEANKAHHPATHTHTERETHT